MKEKIIMLRTKATKTDLVSLLRSRGIQVPSIRGVYMEKLKDGTYWLRWTDEKGKPKSAYYRCFGGRPYLLESERWEWTELSVDECLNFNLLEEVPDCGQSV